MNPVTLMKPCSVTKALFVLLGCLAACSARAVNEAIPECDPCHCVGAGGGSLAYTNIAFSDNPVCVNTIVFANAEGTVVGGIWKIYCENETTNCPPYYVTNWPSIVTNWYTVSGPGGYFDTGSGGGVSITPTNCGDYTVVVSGIWTNYNYCDPAQPGQGGSNSVSGTLRVIKVDIAEDVKYVCVCDSTSYTLTNTCGNVTWEVWPSEPGGPYVEGSMIIAGTNCGDYWQVIARSVENTNCTDSATLKVVKVKIEFPYDADANGLIDDPGNEFAFDANSPAVLAIPCAAPACPDPDNYRWTIEDVGEIKGVWNPHVAGNPFIGKGSNSEVIFTNMPLHNSAFGRKTITLSYEGLSCSDEEFIEVFFDPSARNNPGPPGDPPPNGVASEDLVP